MTIGDVVGKGPAAAATAALARHTLRVAAIQSRPSRILQFLNDAVLRESPGPTCTVVYARIDLHQGAERSCCPSAGIHRRSCFGPMAASSRWVAVACSARRRTPSCG